MSDRFVVEPAGRKFHIKDTATKRYVATAFDEDWAETIALKANTYPELFSAAEFQGNAQ